MLVYQVPKDRLDQLVAAAPPVFQDLQAPPVCLVLPDRLVEQVRQDFPDPLAVLELLVLPDSLELPDLQDLTEQPVPPGQQVLMELPGSVARLDSRAQLDLLDSLDPWVLLGRQERKGLWVRKALWVRRDLEDRQEQRVLQVLLGRSALWVKLVLVVRRVRWERLDQLGQQVPLEFQGLKDLVARPVPLD